MDMGKCYLRSFKGRCPRMYAEPNWALQEAATPEQRGRSLVSGLATGNSSIAGANASSATMQVPSTMQLL